MLTETAFVLSSPRFTTRRSDLPADTSARLSCPLFRSDRAEDLHLSTLTTLHSLLTSSQTIQHQHISTLSSVNQSSLDSLKTVDLESDLDLYVEFNTRVGLWKEPDGFVWEPASGFYEEGDMSLEDQPKIVLQNSKAPGMASDSTVACED